MKVTLNSIVLAKTPKLAAAESLVQHERDVAAFVNTQAAALAEYLIEKSDNVEIISRILSGTVGLIPAVLEREADNIAARKRQHG